MRYEAMLAVAFVAGLAGAMSQQGVKPPVHELHTAYSAQSVAIPLPAPMPAPSAAQLPATEPEPKVAAAAEPAPAPVAAPAAPVKRVHAKAKKPKLQHKPEIAAAEPPHHSFWYKLFHNSDDDTVATAENGAH